MELQKEIPFYDIKLGNFFPYAYHEGIVGNGDRASHILNFRTDACEWLVSYLGCFIPGKTSLLHTEEKVGWAAVDQYILEKRKVLGCLA